MPIHSAGTPLSFSQIQTEFGGTHPISMTEYYGEGTLPTSGTISVSDFYGQSAVSTQVLAGPSNGFHDIKAGYYVTASGSNVQPGNNASFPFSGNGFIVNGHGKQKNDGSPYHPVRSGWTEAHGSDSSSSPSGKRRRYIHTRTMSAPPTGANSQQRYYQGWKNTNSGGTTTASTYMRYVMDLNIWNAPSNPGSPDGSVNGVINNTTGITLTLATGYNLIAIYAATPASGIVLDGNSLLTLKEADGTTVTSAACGSGSPWHMHLHDPGTSTNGGLFVIESSGASTLNLKRSSPTRQGCIVRWTITKV